MCRQQRCLAAHVQSLWPVDLQGWAHFYDFNFSDVRSGADIVVANCGTQQPDWKKLRGLLLNADYGGRVDNAWDFQVGANECSHVYELWLTNACYNCGSQVHATMSFVAEITITHHCNTQQQPPCSRRSDFGHHAEH